MTTKLSKNIITAKSWRGNEYYYNYAKGCFINCNDADIWSSEDYDCDESMIEAATGQAFMGNLTKVKLETIEEPTEQ